MQVTLAKSAGFCFGVKRAVNMVYEEVDKTNEPIYTYGPIIHNDEVVKDFESKGVKLVRELKELQTFQRDESSSVPMESVVQSMKKWKVMGLL